MATKYVVASGNWSNPGIWSGGTLPQAGDDIVHPSPYIVVLDITPPSLGNYTLNGLLLLRAAGGVSLTVTSLSGSGSLDLQSITNPDGAEISPCVLQATSSVLDFTNLGSLFSYYSNVFHRTQHGAWWSWENYGDTPNFIFPKIVNTSTSGGDLVITVSSPDNSPARWALAYYVGKTTQILLPLRDIALSEKLFLSLQSATVNSIGTITIAGGGGLLGRVPNGAYIAFVEHVALAPIVLRNARLRGGISLRGVCISSGCSVEDVVYLDLCCIRSPVDFISETTVILHIPRSAAESTYIDVKRLQVWAAEG